MKEHALKISSAAIALIKKHQGLSLEKYRDEKGLWVIGGNDSNLLIVFYVQIMPDDFVMQLHRF